MNISRIAFLNPTHRREKTKMKKIIASHNNTFGFIFHSFFKVISGNKDNVFGGK